MKIVKFNKSKTNNGVSNHTTTFYTNNSIDNISNTTNTDLSNLKELLKNMGIDTDKGTINITNGFISSADSWKFNSNGNGSIGGFLFDNHYMVSQYGFDEDGIVTKKEDITDNGTPNLVLDGMNGEINITSPTANTLKMADININGDTQTFSNFQKTFDINNYFSDFVNGMTIVNDAGNNGYLGELSEPNYIPSATITGETTDYNDTIEINHYKSITVKSLTIEHPLVLANNTDKNIRGTNTLEGIYFQDVFITVTNSITETIVWDGKIHIHKDFIYQGESSYRGKPQYMVAATSEYDKVKFKLTSKRRQAANSTDWNDEDAFVFTLYFNDEFANNGKYKVTYHYNPLYLININLNRITDKYTLWNRKYNVTYFTTTNLENTSIISTQGIKYALGESTDFTVVNDYMKYTNGNSGLLVKDGVVYKQSEGLKAPITNSSTLVKIINGSTAVSAKRYLPNGKVENASVSTDSGNITYAIQPTDEAIIYKGESGATSKTLTLKFPLKTTIGRKIYYKGNGVNTGDILLYTVNNDGTEKQGIIGASNFGTENSESSVISKFWLFDGDEWINFNCA